MILLVLLVLPVLLVLLVLLGLSLTFLLLLLLLLVDLSKQAAQTGARVSTLKDKVGKVSIRLPKLEAKLKQKIQVAPAPEGFLLLHLHLPFSSSFI